MAWRPSDVELSNLSYNERKILNELLMKEESELRATIVQAEARLMYVADLRERTEEVEDK